MEERVDLELSFQRGMELNPLETICVIPFVFDLSDDLIPQGRAQESPPLGRLP